MRNSILPSIGEVLIGLGSFAAVLALTAGILAGAVHQRTKEQPSD